MKKRWLSVLLVILLSVSLHQPALAASKTKTVWVIDSSTLRGEKDMTVEYNEKGLITKLTHEDRSCREFFYNKKSQITKAQELVGDTVIETIKYTYSGKRLIRSVETSPHSDFRSTIKYTWKSDSKIVSKRTTRFPDGPVEREKLSLILGENQRIEKAKSVQENGPLVTTYTYNKKGYLTEMTYDYGLTYKYKIKTDRRGNITKIVTRSNFDDYTAKDTATFHYKKIKVPAALYDLVVKQQRSLLGWSVDLPLLQK